MAPMISWLHPVIAALAIVSIEALTLTEVLRPHAIARDGDLLALIRVPRDVSDGPTLKRQTRESAKYYPPPSTDYKDDARGARALKGDEDRGVKGDSSAALGKRCTTCDNRGDYYGGAGYDRGRGSYDRYYDPYLSYSGGGRGRYDPYSRYDRDRYLDDDRDVYRGRNQYYDRYDPREQYYYDQRGYENDLGGRGRGGGYYDPYYRSRYDPYEDDYYSSARGGGGGYESGYSSRGYGGRPNYYGGSSAGGAGYARGYSYGDRDRYGEGYGGGGYGGGGYGGGGYGGGGYGGGAYGRGAYGGSGYGGGAYGGGGYGGGYGYGSNGYASPNGYGGARTRYPDYDSGYRSTSYLYDRPSSTTADPPKNSDDDRGEASGAPQNGGDRPS